MAGAAGENALPPAESAGRLVLRRITNREYSNIMADLIGDVSQPGTLLTPGALSDGGFEAPSGVTEMDVRVYNATADTLAETALTAGKLGLPASPGPRPRFGRELRGYAFENYDAIGAYRVTESGQAVDASGSFVTPGGSTIAFQNAVDLAHRLAEGSEVQRCIGRQWLRYTMGRKETAAEEASLERAYQAGAQSAGYSLRGVLLSLVGSASFRFRAPAPG